MQVIYFSLLIFGNHILPHLPFLNFLLKIFMKKLLILAAGLATLGLGACNRQSCAAYGNRAEIHRSAPATDVTASAATPATRL